LATPGGGVEEGESELSTARREVYEELNVSVDLRGPVHTSGDRFEHEGILVENTDVFFVGRCSADAPRLDRFTEAERAVMKAAKWGASRKLTIQMRQFFLLISERWFDTLHKQTAIANRSFCWVIGL
jgi:8-oxo-dGTP pyrophosphatase MutT (NUDIX family)